MNPCTPEHETDTVSLVTDGLFKTRRVHARGSALSDTHPPANWQTAVWMDDENIDAVARRLGPMSAFVTRDERTGERVLALLSSYQDGRVEVPPRHWIISPAAGVHYAVTDDILRSDFIIKDE